MWQDVHCHWWPRNVDAEQGVMPLTSTNKLESVTKPSYREKQKHYIRFCGFSEFFVESES